MIPIDLYQTNVFCRPIEVPIAYINAVQSCALSDRLGSRGGES